MNGLNELQAQLEYKTIALSEDMDQERVLNFCFQSSSCKRQSVINIGELLTSLSQRLSLIHI